MAKSKDSVQHSETAIEKATQTLAASPPKKS